MVDNKQYNDKVIKTLANILVVIVNYVASEFFCFADYKFKMNG